jgi:hypothetical protein
MPIIYSTGQIAIAPITKADNAVPDVKTPVTVSSPTPKKRRGRPAKLI